MSVASMRVAVPPTDTSYRLAYARADGALCCMGDSPRYFCGECKGQHLLDEAGQAHQRGEVPPVPKAYDLALAARRGQAQAPASGVPSGVPEIYTLALARRRQRLQDGAR